MRKLITNPKTILKTVVAGAFVFALSYASTANAYFGRDKYQGEYTGNCYCNISGDDCACVIVVIEED